jgi:hypothetical protein
MAIWLPAVLGVSVAKLIDPEIVFSSQLEGPKMGLYKPSKSFSIWLNDAKTTLMITTTQVIGGFVALLWTRVGLECTIVLFRIAESLRAIQSRAEI